VFPLRSIPIICC